jgi:hypothetical protein
MFRGGIPVQKQGLVALHNTLALESEQQHTSHPQVSPDRSMPAISDTPRQNCPRRHPASTLAMTLVLASSQPAYGPDAMLYARRSQERRHASGMGMEGNRSLQLRHVVGFNTHRVFPKSSRSHFLSISQTLDSSPPSLLSQAKSRYQIRQRYSSQRGVSCCR